MFNNLDSKQKIIFIICIIIMILVIIYYFFTIIDTGSVIEYEDTIIQENNETSSTVEDIETSIVVYITGEVISPGIVNLETNSRIQDAIDSADGLTENADLTNVNLAYVLSDGQKIYIPNKNDNGNLSIISGDDGDAIIKDNFSSGLSDNSNLEININTATQTQLEELPGIGPSTALKIIEYRNKHGKFNSIDDLKNVSGIGEKKFESLKEYVSVN